MRIPSIFHGALLGLWLCLFVLSFCNATSDKIEESKTTEAVGIKEEKSFFSHEPIFKKHHDFFHHPLPSFKKPYIKHIPIYKPAPHPVPIYKPKPTPVPVPIYKPKPHPIPVYKPKPTPVPIYIPKPVYTPYPHPVPVFKKPSFHDHPIFKKPLPPYFSHPKKPCPPFSP
ncbi:hypothetical protein TIFTF001_022874 [Ficus carica]|uniref:Proline-rich protein 4-like n=1 Tax=Ficus carica TaxID=3494 RepID=A0AA88AJC9_FICCA|nr:hypothetical protein TIFTF001_022874 [Ficus carica]